MSPALRKQLVGIANQTLHRTPGRGAVIATSVQGPVNLPLKTAPFHLTESSGCISLSILNLIKVNQIPAPRSFYSLSEAVKGERQAYSGIAGTYVPHTAYNRYKLNSGAEFRGPAIIEERESTVIVGEDASISVDKYGFLWIEFGQPGIGCS